MPRSIGQLVWVLLLIASTSQARNLSDQMGIGANFQDFNGLTSLSLRYHLSKYVSMNFVAGFNTASSGSQIGIKAYRNLFLEEQLNFSVGAGAFLVTSNTGATNSGMELDGMFMAEFFLPGLNRLSFALEGGIGIRTLSTVSIASFGGAAIHYYL